MNCKININIPIVMRGIKTGEFMGLFFEESKSTKPFIIIKRVVSIIWLFVMLIAVITTIMTSFDNIYIRLLIILTGVSSIIEGIEHYVRRDNK